MEDRPDPLLGQIEAFLSQTGMTATAFGRAAIADPKFVFELREGRECRRSTRARALAFIHGRGRGRSLLTG